MEYSFTKNRRVACPRSWDAADLLTNYKIHYATPEELVANGGVCCQCRAAITKRNANFLGGRVEKPVDITLASHHGTDIEHDHVGFTDGHEAVQTADFDFAGVSALLGEVERAPEDAREQAGEVLRRILIWCFSGPRVRLKTAAAKFAALVACVNPDILGAKMFKDIGRELRLTKGAISRHAVDFEKAFHFQASRCRSETARAAMAKAQIGHRATNVKGTTKK